MGDVIEFKRVEAKFDLWEQTLPDVPRHDPTWMVGVLEDLSAFADLNCSLEVQHELKASTRKVRHLLLMQEISN